MDSCAGVPFLSVFEVLIQCGMYQYFLCMTACYFTYIGVFHLTHNEHMGRTTLLLQITLLIYEYSCTEILWTYFQLWGL